MTGEEQALNALFVPASRAECVRILRGRLGYTQDQVATETGLTRERVSKMETQFMKVSDKLWDYMLQQAYGKLFFNNTLPYAEFRRVVTVMVNHREKELRHGR